MFKLIFILIDAIEVFVITRKGFGAVKKYLHGVSIMGNQKRYNKFLKEYQCWDSTKIIRWIDGLEADMDFGTGEYDMNLKMHSLLWEELDRRKKDGK